MALLLFLFAGSGFACTNALTIGASSSNVCIKVGSITFSDGATLGTCTPALSLSPPTTAQPVVLDPSALATSSVTCAVNIPASALLQSHFEQGFMAWTGTVDSVLALGSNTSVNAAQAVNFNKTLTQTPRYTLGIKRVGLIVGDPMAAISTAGECITCDW
jgi:hypothetical protein